MPLKKTLILKNEHTGKTNKLSSAFGTNTIICILQACRGRDFFVTFTPIAVG